MYKKKKTNPGLIEKLDSSIQQRKSNVALLCFALLQYYNILHLVLKSISTNIYSLVHSFEFSIRKMGNWKTDKYI